MRLKKGGDGGVVNDSQKLGKLLGVDTKFPLKAQKVLGESTTGTLEKDYSEVALLAGTALLAKKDEVNGCSS